MFSVSDILTDAAEALGVTEDQTDLIFRRLTAAIRLLADKGDWDPLFGVVDIAVQNRIVSLPRDIGTVLQVNIGGKPAIGRDRFFNFHINGVGDDGFNQQINDRSWADLGFFPTILDPTVPVVLTAYSEDISDTGAEIWAYGKDLFGKPIWSTVNGVTIEGYKVPLVNGPNTSSAPIIPPAFGTIDRIRKKASTAPIMLAGAPVDGTQGALLGIYFPQDTEPVFRRLKLNMDTPWVRVAFRRKTFKITSTFDQIPLQNSFAIILALKAVRYYIADNVELAREFEASAASILEDDQIANGTPVASPMQVAGQVGDRADNLD